MFEQNTLASAYIHFLCAIHWVMKKFLLNIMSGFHWLFMNAPFMIGNWQCLALHSPRNCKLLGFKVSKFRWWWWTITCTQSWGGSFSTFNVLEIHKIVTTPALRSGYMRTDTISCVRFFAMLKSFRIKTLLRIQIDCSASPWIWIEQTWDELPSNQSPFELAFQNNFAHFPKCNNNKLTVWQSSSTSLPKSVTI